MFKSQVLKSIVFGLLVISSAAAADPTPDGSVTLGGTVTSVVSITAFDTAGAMDLDLMNGQQIVKVSDLTMTTNNEQGLKLTATGDDSGRLTKSGGTAIPFRVVSVDDEATAPASGAFSAAPGVPITVSASSIAGEVLRDLYIMYTPATLQDPGDYAGSITLLVEDN